MDSKQLVRVEIKNAAKGEVEAVFATFDVVDKDNDVTRKGAFSDGAPVHISAYGHKLWEGVPPVGKGRIVTDDVEARAVMQFFMNTQAGRETFELVKAMAEDDGPGMEWSYGFNVVDSEPGEVEGKSVRVLKQLKVHEVSPVMQGAGVGTRTLGVKAHGDRDIDDDHARDECEDPECEDHPTDDDDEKAKRKRRKKRNAAAARDEEREAAKSYYDDVKRTFSAQQRRALSDSGKAMPDGSFPIVSEEDLHNAIRLAGNASNPAAARRHIMRRARAMGHADLIPDTWKSFNTDIEIATEIVAEIREGAERVVALRAERGKSLSRINTEALDGLRAELAKLDVLMGNQTEPDHADELRSIYLGMIEQELE